MNDFNKLWSNVLDELKSKLTDYSLQWFKDLEVYLENDTVIISSKDEFTIEWLSVRYRILIEDTLKKFTDKEYELVFKLKSEK